MATREMNPGLGRAGRVRPQLETLEDRCCPSAVGLHVATPVLVVSGSASDSTIIVRDDGRGDVTVTLNGKTKSYTGVQTIDIESKTADDHINYALTNTLKQSETLNLDLGKGNDEVRLDFTKGVSAPKLNVNINGGGGRGDNEVAAVFGNIDNTDLNLNAQLGGGWDHFLAQFKGDLQGHADVNVNVNGGRLVDGVSVQMRGAIGKDASLTVHANDGSGDEILHVDYAGKLLGHLNLQEKAGAGWDWVESNVDLAAGSTGWLTAHEVGGAGSDLMILMVRNGGSLKGLNAVISGVNGNSAVDHTPNVKLVR